MSDKTNNLALLPAGFRDLLPPEAEREAQAVARLATRFAGFGYHRVKPPLMEFEDSLLKGPGAALSSDTFRVMDPVSSRMMGLRSDITAQLARIARARLSDAPRPLRLTYANDVLRMQARQQRTDRQFCQVGCEIIGAEADEADIELCIVALLGLKDLGIDNITLDFAMPRLIDQIVLAHDIGVQDAVLIKEALVRRDGDKIPVIKGVEIFRSLLNLAGPVDVALAGLRDMDLPKQALEDVKRVAGVHKALNEILPVLGLDNVSVTLDPAEHKGFEYHEHLGFTLFAQGVSGELGRGGRYCVSFGESDDKETATGFTLYMDTVLKAFKPADNAKSIFVEFGTDWKDVRKLQDEGWQVIRGLSKEQEVADCTHVYKDGKIKEIG